MRGKYIAIAYVKPKSNIIRKGKKSFSQEIQFSFSRGSLEKGKKRVVDRCVGKSNRWKKCSSRLKRRIKRRKWGGSACGLRTDSSKNGHRTWLEARSKGSDTLFVALRIRWKKMRPRTNSCDDELERTRRTLKYISAEGCDGGAVRRV